MSSTEMTADDLKQAAAEVRKRRISQRKEKSLTVRVQSQTIDKARDLLGDGYTSVIRRLIVKALDHPEMLKGCL